MTLLYIFTILIMAITAPFCEATSISYLALFTPIIFLGKREYILSLILFASVMFYRVPPGIPIMPLLIIMYIGSIIIERIIRVRWNINIKALILFLAACGYLVLSCYTSLSGSYDSLFKMITFIALVYFAVYDKSCDTTLLQKLLLIASVVGIVGIAAKLILSPDMSMEGRASISAFHNPNVVARGVAAMILIIFVGRKFWGRYIPNIILDGTMIIGFIAIFLTGSRMGILSTIITIFVLSYVSSKDKKTRSFKFAFIGVIIIGLFSVFLSVSDIDLGRYEQGFASETIEGDARVASSHVLWENAITKNPLMGIGLGSENSEWFLEYVPDADNFFVDALTQVGIIGFAAMFILFIISFRSLNKYIAKDSRNISLVALPFAFLISQISYCFSETVFDELILWYTFALTQIYINTTKYGCISNISRS